MSLVVGTILACGSIREDEFLCENAVSHLQQCCPIFHTAIACNYEQGGCDESATYPEIDTVQSNCIIDQPCDVLRRNGVCDGVAQLSDMGLEGQATTPPVCTQPSALLAPPRDDGGTVAQLSCISESDCKVSGDVCCAFGASFGVGTLCAPSPCSGGRQICGSTSECSPGTACEAIPGVGLAKFCVPVDASIDAMTDAPSIATDATDAGSQSDAVASDAGVTSSDADAENDAQVRDGS